MNKKIIGLILGIAAVLFVAAFTMGAISADNPQEVKVGDMTFHLPDGYKEVNSTEKDNTKAVTYSKDNKTIFISVTTTEGKISSISLRDGEVEKEFARKKGGYNAEKHTFKYADGHHMIIIKAPEENMIADIIK